MTTTLSRPGSCSSTVKLLPRTGYTPSTSNNAADARNPMTFLGSSPPVRVWLQWVQAARWSKLLDCSSQSRKFIAEAKSDLPRVSRSKSTIRRPGSSNGNGLSTVPLMTLNTALDAPMPRARDRMATVANPGLLISMRPANRISDQMSFIASLRDRTICRRGPGGVLGDRPGPTVSRRHWLPAARRRSPISNSHARNTLTVPPERLAPSRRVATTAQISSP